MGALTLAGLLYGYNWVVMKTGLRYADASVFAAMRVFFGAVLLFILLAVLRRSFRPTNPLLTLVVGLFGMTGSIGLSIWALESGGAGKTSVLVYTMPMWLLLMSWVILGERIRGLQWFSVVLALAGLVFVLSPWSAGGTPLSSILGVAAGICSAASSVAAKILCRDRKVDLLGLNAWQMLFGSVPLVVIAFLTADAGPEWTGSFVAALLYNVVLVCGAALLLWFYTLRHLAAGTAGLGRLLAPVVGVVASWIQLGERPDRYELVGMVLIIVGLASLAVWQILRDRKTAELATETDQGESRLVCLAEEPPGE